MKLFIIILITVLSQHALSENKKDRVFNLSTVYYNNSALKKLEALIKKKQENPKEPIDFKALSEAEQSLYRALEKEALNPILHFNLGIFLALKNEASVALKEWDFSLKHWKKHQLEEKFMTLFNQAFIKGLLNQKEEALSLYQKSLEIAPESLEVRTNIELLFQQNQSGSGGSSEKGSSGTSQNQEPPQNKNQQVDEKQAQNLLNEIRQQDRQIRERNLRERQQGSFDGKNW